MGLIMTAIKASLHSYKSLATRPEIQITFQVPQEYAADALKMLGVVDPGGSQWFAIARLVADQSSTNSGPDMNAEQSAHKGPSPLQQQGQGQDKPRTPFNDLKRSQQAGMRIKEEPFKRWLNHEHGDDHAPAVTYDEILKFVLNIQSKTELDTDEAAGKRWDALLATYDHRNTVR